METKLITFGGGSFWTIKAVFNEVKGVVKVIPGYSGGIEEPHLNSYFVRPEMRDFAEVVQVEYDPSIRDLFDLIYIFMTIHDPTSYEQKGGITYSLYRSIIFYENSYEKAIINLVLNKTQQLYDYPIITEVKKFERFYTAKENNQKFYQHHKNYGTDLPFLEIILGKFRKQHFDKLKNPSLHSKQIEVL